MCLYVLDPSKNFRRHPFIGHNLSWSDNNVVEYLAWDDSEPNHLFQSTECVQINYNLKWSVADCQEQKPFFCEQNIHCDSREFKCKRGNCIPISDICEGNKDCPDYDDESTDLCHENRACPDGGLLCGAYSGCIERSRVCDGANDCRNKKDEAECDQWQCDSDRFKCNNGKCISKSGRCEGNDNCGDNSDEIDCDHWQCDEDRWKCGDGICLWKSVRCDGKEDCSDESDEKDCDPVHCDDVDTWNCGNEKCVRNSYRCDGEDDCGNNSDEIDCEHWQCGNFTWKCGNGICILNFDRCDGKDNCGDNSDEIHCEHWQCGDDRWKCSNGKCIHNSDRCDGVYNCGDNSDERDCAHWHCVDDRWKCSNEKCVRNSYRCDGDDDCGDNSDEKDCDRGQCDTNRWKCSNGKCLDNFYRCDGNDNCGDNSDEIDCEHWQCGDDRWKCSNGKCIHNSDRCDGRDDCGDDSDEKECALWQCANGRWKCSNGKCVYNSYRCNGDDNCGDNSDEKDCGIWQCYKNKLKCDNGKCVEKGFRCNDIDDCGDNTDEKYCDFSGQCDGPRFQCDNGKCVWKVDRCDKVDDCGDKTDERDCDKVRVSVFITAVGDDAVEGNCKPRWKRFGHKCYRIFTKKNDHIEGMNFTEATKYCRELSPATGSHLVAITSQVEQDFITAELGQSDMDGDVLIGLNRHEGKFQWVDGTDTDFDNWRRLGAKLRNNGECVIMQTMEMEAGQWKQGFDSTTVLTRYPSITEPKEVSEGIECPDNWIRYRHSCYVESLEPSNWLEAEETCKSLQEGCSLVSIQDNFESVFLKRLTEHQNSGFWIGLKSRAVFTDKYRYYLSWSDHRPVQHLEWDSGEPKFSLRKLCVQLGKNLKWSVTSCQEKKPFICVKHDRQYEKKSQVYGFCSSYSGLVDDMIDVGSSKCYAIRKNKKFIDAGTECQRLGGAMAVFKTRDDMSVLRPYLRKTENGSFWVGIHAASDKADFSTLTGESIPEDMWDKGQPRKGKDERCAAIDSQSGLLRNLDCDSFPRDYICDFRKGATREEAAKCVSGDLECDKHRCVPLKFLCNGFNDCEDLSDESADLCHENRTCPDEGFLCGVYDGCIPRDKVCDGKRDCVDKRDEEGCPPDVIGSGAAMSWCLGLMHVSKLFAVYYVCIYLFKLFNMIHRECNN